MLRSRQDVMHTEFGCLTLGSTLRDAITLLSIKRVTFEDSASVPQFPVVVRAREGEDAVPGKGCRGTPTPSAFALLPAMVGRGLQADDGPRGCARGCTR